MKTFEVIAAGDDWLVEHEGVVLARFAEQAEALADVSRRLSEADIGETGASLIVRFGPRAPKEAA